MPRGPNWQQESVAAVTDKLHQLHATLPPDQQSVLEAVLTQAAEASPTQSHLDGASQSIIFVGGRTSPIRIWLNPADQVTLNPQPIPPGRDVPATNG
jgi:hypothetical protein